MIGQMVALARDIDPQFFRTLWHRADSGELPEWAEPPMLHARGDGRTLRRMAMARAQAQLPRGQAFAREFDAKLGKRTSKLIDYSPNAPRVAAEAYRAVLGLTESQCSDAEAIDRLLNPARNLYRLETLNVGVHAPLMRALQHVNYTFAKKISHTADSQDQRHRMVPGSRPLLTLSDTREPDYVTPMLLDSNPRAKEVYERAMHDAWNAKNELLDRGVPAEIALYVLPNAKSIRLVESGSLLHLLHKWTMRTCFNAQEEIYRASMDELDATPRSPPAICEICRPALPSPRRHHHADLHRRLALLRRKSLARFPQHPAPHLRNTI